MVDALARQGAEATQVPWDGSHPDLREFDALVLRATWNYPEHPEEFVKFLEAASRSSVLLNPLGAVRENLHKGYLLKLAAAGVPVVPTQLMPRGIEVDESSLPPGTVVVKPAISCGSYRTKYFDGGSRAAAAAFATVLAEDGDVLLQPWIAGFRESGERSLVWIDGEFTHGVLKRPRFEGEDESVTALDMISVSDRALAERALATSASGLVYARVDLVDTPEGAVVSELECIEPSLFFWVRPASADRLATAIVREAIAGAGV
jgi:glutathione synthase/RimK-type ligase-like ATP-grasp enzyme